MIVDVAALLACVKSKDYTSCCFLLSMLLCDTMSAYRRFDKDGGRQANGLEAS